MAKRAAKQQREIADKFQDVRFNVPPLVPMNEKQKRYIDLIRSKSCIIATGHAGSSKTYIPTVIACDNYRAGLINKIYLVRPAMSNSKSLGFFAGSIQEKMTVWLMPILSTMYDRLGKAVVDIAIKNGDIEFIPLETIKGRSFGGGCFVIVDEAEDLTIDEITSVLTRQGDCTMVLAGDIKQSALKESSGLAFAIEKMQHVPTLQEHSGHIDFSDYEDIVRGKACKDWIIAISD